MGTPLTKTRPIGLAHSNREISKFAGISLTQQLTEEILQALKIDWVNSFIELHCY